MLLVQKENRIITCFSPFINIIHPSEMSYIQKKFKHVKKKTKPVFWVNIFFFFLIYFWLHWVFIAEHILVATSGGCSLVVVLGLNCSGFSCRGAWALEHGLCSYGTWALLLQGMWGRPRPRNKPMTLALAGGVLTSRPLKGCYCKPCVMPGFVISRGEDFNPGSETRLDYLEPFV